MIDGWFTNMVIFHSFSGWSAWTPPKNISQLFTLFPIYGKKCSKPPTSFCMFTRWYPLPWKRNTDLLDDAFGSSDQMQQAVFTWSLSTLLHLGFQCSPSNQKYLRQRQDFPAIWVCLKRGYSIPCMCWSSSYLLKYIVEWKTFSITPTPFIWLVLHTHYIPIVYP